MHNTLKHALRSKSSELDGDETLMIEQMSKAGCCCKVPFLDMLSDDIPAAATVLPHLNNKK